MLSRPVLAWAWVLAAGLMLAPDARAWTWLQAPQEDTEAAEDEIEPLAPLPEITTQRAAGQCLAAILAAEQRHNIPNHLLLALGIQEAGWKSPQGLTVWPWSVNAAGDGRRFNSRAEAEAFVAQKQAAGVSSIDVGCLQINLRWHPEAFANPAQGFDPVRNVDYAARFLRGLYEESGDWMLAAGRYHSRSDGPQEIYLAGLSRNQSLVRSQIGQLVALAGGSEQDIAQYRALDETLAPATPPNYRTQGAIWGADLAGAEGAYRTLYSAQDLQPVLPDFLPPEA